MLYLKHEFWRYLVGSAAVIAANFIGQIPFLIALISAINGPGQNEPRISNTFSGFISLKFLHQNLFFEHLLMLIK